MHQYPSLLATFIIHFPYVLDLIYSSLRLHLCKRYQHHIDFCARHPTSCRDRFLCTYAEGPLPVVESPICTGCSVRASFFFYRLFVTIAFLCQRLIAPYHLVYTPYTQEDYNPSLFTFFPAHHSTPAGPETNPAYQQDPCQFPATHLSDHTSRLRVEAQQIPHTAFATLSPHWLRLLSRVSSLHSLLQHRYTRSLFLSVSQCRQLFKL